MSKLVPVRLVRLWLREMSTIQWEDKATYFGPERCEEEKWSKREEGKGERRAFPTQIVRLITSLHQKLEHANFPGYHPLKSFLILTPLKPRHRKFHH